MEGNVIEGMPRRRFLPKPVKLGEKRKVHIEAMGEKGDGIAKVDGFVVFVRGAEESEIGNDVEVNITYIGRKFAVGEKV